MDVLLFAPDVLPQHCCVRRQDAKEEDEGYREGERRRRAVTLLKPLHGAPVTRNGVLLKEEVELSPGDLVGLGRHYLFMFKDPTLAPGTPQAPSWMTSLDFRSSCASCGGASPKRRRPPHWRDPQGAEAALCYQPEQEDQVLQQILDQADADVPKLTAAFLLSLCIQRSAAAFTPPQFRQLLLQVASRIQQVTWVSEGGRGRVRLVRGVTSSSFLLWCVLQEKTKELAAVQTET